MKNLLGLAVLASIFLVIPLRASTLDTVILGDLPSEKVHDFKDSRSEITQGGLDEPARRLLPPETPGWEGGSVSFQLKVDPEKPNYLTVRLWGSDRSEERLVLLCDGKQIGYRHLGDIENLDTPNGEPAYNGRFIYQTTPLPLELTKGKTQLAFEIRSNGRIWGYGGSFSQYQKNMELPTRGIYRAYTHTDGFFSPASDEKQGSAPVDPPLRTAPGEEVIALVKERVNGEISARLAEQKPLNQQQLWFLARAYPVKWTQAYQNDAVVKKAVEAIDLLFVTYQKNPKIAQSEPSIYNPDWFGLGPAAYAVSILAKPLAPLLDEEIAGAPGIKRRAGWSQMFVASRDWHRENRRLYTNQSMINDTFGIYLSNRGVAALDPTKALPEAEVRKYLYQSIGLEPWLGSEKDGVPQKPMGDAYFQLTARGLTKELGFVGYYGEVLDWMTGMYQVTRPSLDEPGDERIKAQLIQAARARAAFRYPMLDSEGNIAMRSEATVGWRDQGHYAGDITYGQRPTWDSSAIESAAATLDPALIGYAQQMFAENQFFASVQRQLNDKGLRITAGLLAIPDDYEKLRNAERSSQKLPMSKTSPNFVFSDEEDGVIAIKNGEEILYASLYWRARYGINFLARVHFITPILDRVAVVRQKTEYDPSGDFYTRPDMINMGFGGGGVKYPTDVHSAHTGEKLPIAKVPAGVKFKPGDENVYAGKGTFYTLRYGPYLIGMNMTTDKTFELKTPPDAQSAQELVSEKPADLQSPLKVAPRSTVVLYLK